MITKTGYTEFRLDGAKALEGLLNEFPERIQRDIVNASARAGANLFKKEIKKNIKANGSVKSGRLLKSIKTRKAKGQHGVFYIYSDAPHAHLIEMGTGPRKFKKPHFVRLKSGLVWVDHSGSVPAKPFFRPGIDDNKTEAMRAIAMRMAKRMATESKKMSQKWGTMSKSYRKKLQK